MRFPQKSMTYLTLRSERSERLEGPIERFTSSQDEVSPEINDLPYPEERLLARLEGLGKRLTSSRDEENLLVSANYLLPG